MSTVLGPVLARVSAGSVRSVTGTFGVLATALLVGLLVEHEIVGAMAPGRLARHRRAVELAILALLVLFAVVVIVRFKWLSL